jgi:hypothetical protein
MADAPWQLEVARLLEEAAQALRAKRLRRVIVALGTAVAYVQRARREGDHFADELLSHTVESPKDDPTERFTFSPGELEALGAQSTRKP